MTPAALICRILTAPDQGDVVTRNQTLRSLPSAAPREPGTCVCRTYLGVARLLLACTARSAQSRSRRNNGSWGRCSVACHSAGPGLLMRARGACCNKVQVLTLQLI
jgi:hypothetical protein